MPNAASTYDPGGTLRTVTDAPDYSLINLGRDLVNDRRDDYEERRKNRGTERPVGGGTAPPVYRNPASGSPGPNIMSNAGVAPRVADWSQYGAPLLPAMQFSPQAGPAYTMDPQAMNPAQRRAFLPEGSGFQTNIGTGSGLGTEIRSGSDPGWEQFLAMNDRRRAIAARGTLG